MCLLKINDNKYIKNNLIYFILSITILFYHDNFNQYNEFDLIRYEKIIKLKLDLVEEVRNDIYIYEEDEFVNEKTDEQKNEIEQQIINDNEMNDALDVIDDDYNPEDGDEEVMFHDQDN